MVSIPEDVSGASRARRLQSQIDARVALTGASKAVEALKNSVDLRGTFTALLDLKAASKTLKRTEFCQKQLIEREQTRKQEIDETYREQMINDQTGWGRFRGALRRLD